MPFLLLAALVPLASAPSPEQTAFDYFAAVLVAQYYPRAKHLYLTGYSEATTLKGPFQKCFSEAVLRVAEVDSLATATTPVPIAYQKSPVFKRASAFNSKRLQVRIYRAIAGPSVFYTYLTVSKRNHFTDHYLLKVSGPAPGIVEVCRQEELW